MIFWEMVAAVEATRGGFFGLVKHRFGEVLDTKIFF
jgi:hypothetical protein